MKSFTNFLKEDLSISPKGNLVDDSDLDSSKVKMSPEAEADLVYLEDLYKSESFKKDKFSDVIEKEYRIAIIKDDIKDSLVKALFNNTISSDDIGYIRAKADAPVFYNSVLGEGMKKFSDYKYTNMADDFTDLKKDQDGEDLQELNLEDFEIVKVIDVIKDTTELTNVLEGKRVLLNSGVNIKDIKKGDELYVTVMLQPKSIGVGLSPQNSMGVIKCRVADLYQGLGVLKNKGLM